jgi:hypothetical protein
MGAAGKAAGIWRSIFFVGSSATATASTTTGDITLASEFGLEGILIRVHSPEAG